MCIYITYSDFLEADHKLIVEVEARCMICICIYVYMYMYLHSCVYIYLYMYVYTWNMYICIYTCMHMRTIKLIGSFFWRRKSSQRWILAFEWICAACFLEFGKNSLHKYIPQPFEDTPYRWGFQRRIFNVQLQIRSNTNCKINKLTIQETCTTLKI